MARKISLTLRHMTKASMMSHSNVRKPGTFPKGPITMRAQVLAVLLASEDMAGIESIFENRKTGLSAVIRAPRGGLNLCNPLCRKPRVKPRTEFFPYSKEIQIGNGRRIFCADIRRESHFEQEPDFLLMRAEHWASDLPSTWADPAVSAQSDKNQFNPCRKNIKRRYHRLWIEAAQSA